MLNSWCATSDWGTSNLNNYRGVFDRLIADANYLDAQDFELYVGGSRVYYSSAEIIPANSDPVTVGDKGATCSPSMKVSGCRHL